MVREHPPHWLTRVLTVIAVATMAAGGGTVVAGAADEAPRPSDAARLGSAIAAAATPEVDAAVETAVRLVNGLDVELTEPEPAPANAYAATPVVVHGMLEIPAIGLAQPLHEGVTLTSINRGPSHWPGTAMPGAVGNVVVAGHRTTYTRPFHDLDLLQPGDELVFTMHDGSRFVYALDRLEIVDPSAIHIVDQGLGHTATLFACHPKGSARQRIVGHFTLVG